MKRKKRKVIKVAGIDSFAGEKTPAKALFLQILKEDQQGRKKAGVLLVLFLTSYFVIDSKAQVNLVPNGDFEIYTSCPTSPGQTNRAFPWYDPNNSTSDYFNSCAPVSSGVNVPGNMSVFFQFAHSGVGYTGLFGEQSPSANHREYIQVKLSDSLSYSSCYVVTFYCNLLNAEKYAINNMGAFISQTAISCPQNLPYNLTPQILLPGNPTISDTLNWVKVQGLYNANGGEQYITIGNFQYDSNTVFQVINASSVEAESYYYIDDVSLFKLPSANAGRDTTICHGDSAQLGNGNYIGVTYSWQPTTGLSNATIGNPRASPTVASTYYLTQTSPCGITRDTVVVTLGNCWAGVNEMRIGEIEIYPNPANDKLNVEIKGYKGKASKVKIYNVLGEMVKGELKMEDEKLTIDIDDLPNGLYFIEVQNKEGILRRKLVKE